MPENYELTFLLNYAVTSSDESPVFRLDVDVTGKPPYYSAALSALRRKVGADVLPVEEVNTELIDGYVRSLFSAGVSKNSVSSYLRAIRSLYNKQMKLSALPRTDAFSCATDLIDRAASARVRTARSTLPRQRSDARFWRVVRNTRFADRNAIRTLVASVAADADVFMPDAVLYRRNRAGKLKKDPRPPSPPSAVRAPIGLRGRPFAAPNGLWGHYIFHSERQPQIIFGHFQPRDGQFLARGRHRPRRA